MVCGVWGEMWGVCGVRVVWELKGGVGSVGGVGVAGLCLVGRVMVVVKNKSNKLHITLAQHITYWRWFGVSSHDQLAQS